MTVPRRMKASRWVLVGSVSIAVVTWVPVNRTWLRVKVEDDRDTCETGHGLILAAA